MDPLAPVPSAAALDLDRLEAAAAAPQATPEGARWVSQRAIAHLFSEAGTTDPASGDTLWAPLTGALGALRAAIHSGRTDLPSDEIQRLVNFASDPLHHIVRRPRSRLVREHQVVPLHRLQELDATSLLWLSRLPGRSAREKLGARYRALGVQRRFDVDAPENRLARWTLETLAEHVERRLRWEATDEAPHPDLTPNWAALTQLLTLRRFGLRRSLLAEVPPQAGVRPNNALLSDRHYSKVLRLSRRLRDLDDVLLLGWTHLRDHVHTVLFWALVAELVGQGGHVQERLCRTGAHGWSLDSDRVGLRCDILCASAPAPRRFLLLALQGDTLSVHAAPSRKRLGKEPPLLQCHLDVDLDTPVAPRRGVRLRVAQQGTGTTTPLSATVDRKGLQTLITNLADRVAPRSDHPPGPSLRAEPGEPVGLDASRGRFEVSLGGARRRARTTPYALRVSDPDGVEHWLPGRAGALPDLQSTSATVVAASTLERARLEGQPRDPGGGGGTLAYQTSLGALAEEIPALRHATVGVTVPDTLDSAGLRAVRAGTASAFEAARPVWRSVAAAVGWQGTWTAETGAKEGDAVLVLDPRDEFLAVTVLAATVDNRLEEAAPQSRGIVWERRPPLIAGEVAQALAMDDLLTACLGLGAPDPALMETGKAEALVFGSSPVFAPTGESWRRLRIDDKQRRTALRAWQDALATAAEAWSRGGALSDTLKRLKNEHPKATLHVLLVGHPFGDLPDREAVRMALGRLAKPFPSPDVHWLKPAHSALAHGAEELARRVRDGLPTWTEWVPDLHIRVVQDGRYTTLPLLPSRRGHPLLGERVRHRLTQSLTLHPGPSVYRLPVLMGEHGEHPTSDTIVLRSSGFPLQQPQAVHLTFSFAIGATEGHTVEVTPADGSPLGVTGRWEALREHEPPPSSPWRGALPTRETRHEGSDPQSRSARVGRFATGLERACARIREASGLDEWGSAAHELKAFHRYLPRLNAEDLEAVAADLDATPGLEWLRRIAQDTAPGQPPDLAPPRDLRATAVEILLRLGLLSDRLEADLLDELQTTRPTLPDGRLSAVHAVRALALSGTAEHLEPIWSASRTPLLYYKNTSLYNNVVGALGRVGRRNPEALERLAEARPAAPAHLVRLAEYALERLAQSLPDAIAAEAARAATRDSPERLFASPFENACSLLLAIAGLRGARPEVLPAGGEQALNLATLVGIVDGLIRGQGWQVKGTSGLDVPQTDSLSGMSELAFATVTVLLGEPPSATVTIPA